MHVKDYLAVAHKTDTLPTGRFEDEINPRLGIAGEVGYLLTQMKKEVRDDRPTAEATKAAIKDELGDILWYAVTIARRTHIDFQRDILFGNLQRIQTIYAEGGNLPPTPLFAALLKPGGEVTKIIKTGPVVADTFDGYQGIAVKTSKYKDRDALVPFLAQIWNNVNDLLKPFGAFDEEGKAKAMEMAFVAEALGDIMWYVAVTARLYGLKFSEIAEANKEKILSAFPPKDRRVPTPLFDEGRDALEQFPRRFAVDFVDLNDNTAVMLINGVRVGDPLTDNASTIESGDRQVIDGYRYHDSIHLAFVAVLGWSPVMRKLLMRKRKTDPTLDEVEDGARAQIVEEMIAKMAHSHAVGFDRKTLFGDRTHINLNFLKEIRGLAEGLEVAGGRPEAEACKYWEWQEAILQGFKIYRLLRENRGGRIIVDLNKRKVTFKKLEQGRGTRMPVTKP